MLVYLLTRAAFVLLIFILIVALLYAHGKWIIARELAALDARAAEIKAQASEENLQVSADPTGDAGGNVATDQKYKQMAMNAKVIRCRCGHPNRHRSSTCPVGSVEELGTIAYEHVDELAQIEYQKARLLDPCATMWQTSP